MVVYHELSRAEFDIVASGGGNADSVAVLRAGQVSKHLLMMRFLLDWTRSSAPESWPAVHAAFQLLTAAQRVAPDRVEDVLAHPQVGLWGSRCLRHLADNASGAAFPLEVELGQLGAIAATAGIATGVSFRLEVPLRAGTVLLPGLGMATFGESEGRAVIEHDGVATTVRWGGREVCVPIDPALDAPGWAGLRRLSSGSGEWGISIELVDLGNARDGSDQLAQARVSDEELARWRALFEDAWRILCTEHPDRARAMIAGLAGVLVIPERDSTRFNSATTRDAFGYLESRLPADGLAFAEILVHEFQHSTLYALIDLYPLHNASADEVHFAPWRQDARPIDGLLQGTYAFLWVTEFWQVNRARLGGNEYLRSCFEFARWRRQMVVAADTLLGSGQLTETGTEVVRAIRAKAAGWLAEVLPEQPQVLADRVVEEHRIAWRIANLVPDPAGISALADAWLAGRPCAPGEVATVVVSDSTTRPSTRLSLTQLRWTDPVLFERLCDDEHARTGAGYPRMTDADIAYLRDDLAGAAVLFVGAIAREPDWLAHWSGLAICAPADFGPALRTVPEVVHALAAELRARQQPTGDLGDLVSWLRPLTTSVGPR